MINDNEPNNILLKTKKSILLIARAVKLKRLPSTKNQYIHTSKEKIKSYQQNYPVIFMCFDIPYENKHLTNLSLLERKKVLEKYNTDGFVILEDKLCYMAFA